MKCNISKPTPPAMPNLGKNTKNLPFLLSQSSKGMHQSLATKLFPILYMHTSGAEFMHSDRSWKEMCGMVGNLVAEGGTGKVHRGPPGHAVRKARRRDCTENHTESYRIVLKRTESYDCHVRLSYLCGVIG